MLTKEFELCDPLTADKVNINPLTADKVNINPLTAEKVDCVHY